MSENEKIELYGDQPIRTAWNEAEEEWYFSIVDVVGVLTDSADYNTGRKYWNKLKQRLKEEGNELVTNCHQLKMKASDGKRRLTDVATTEQLLRIIQSIPSKKAEPFKMWLAQVGRERIEETIDPELTIERALETYLNKGYTREWINQRLQAIQVRKELADEWQTHGVQKGVEYAILTDEITKAWSGMSTRKYKNLKGLTKENLRDNMTTSYHSSASRDKMKNFLKIFVPTRSGGMDDYMKDKKKSESKKNLPVEEIVRSIKGNHYSNKELAAIIASVFSVLDDAEDLPKVCKALCNG